MLSTKFAADEVHDCPPAGQQAAGSTTGSGTLDALLFFFVAAWVLSRAGREGVLSHDDSIYLYGGQELLRGVPVYVGMFDHKGPLGQVICGLAIYLSHLAGVDAIHGTRLIFLGIASGTAAGLVLLGRALFGCRYLALTAGAVFTSFWGYGIYAASGNQPKMLMLLFEVTALVAMTRRRWFISGACITLAAFTWQPIGSFFAVALVLVWLSEEAGPARRRSLLHLFAGALLPTLVITGYFAATGTLTEFIDGCFLFNVRYLDNPSLISRQFTSLMHTFVRNGMGMLTVLGICSFAFMYAWRLGVQRASGLSWRGLARDRFAPVLATAILPVLWSIRDYQQYPDFYVLLPFVALGAAWFLSLSARGIAAQVGLQGARARLCCFAPALIFLVFSAITYSFLREDRLPAQRAQAAWIEEQYGDKRIAVIGVPQALVLLERRNVTRYGFLMRGIEEFIDATEPGGFAGWLESVDATQPELLIVDERQVTRIGRLAPVWLEWLEGYERRPSPPIDSVHPWSVFVPRSL